MLIRYFLVILGCILTSQAQAQYRQPASNTRQNSGMYSPFQFEQRTSLDLGIKGDALLMQLDYQHVHQLGETNPLRMGYGLALIRFRAFNDLAYVLDDEDAASNTALDTLQVVDASSTSLNFFILVNYTPNERLEFDLMMDLLGLSWGSEQQALFASGPDDPNPQGADARPERLNSSFGATGSWRTRFQLRYWIYPQWSLQTGVNFWNSAYNAKCDSNQDAQAYSSGLWFWQVGLGYRL